MARDSTHIASIPNDVLENVLLDKLAPEDLCALALVSRRFAALTGSEFLWAALFEARWGAPTALQKRARALAGSYKALYRDKALTDRASAPWTKPSSCELTASLEKLAEAGGERPVAVVFLLDGSGSVNEEEFGTMLSFVESASNTLRASNDDAKVAVVQFSNDTRVEYDLAPVEAELLHKATRDIVRMNGGTNVAVAVQKAGQLLKRGADVDAARHIVLLTDGRVDSYQAREARQMADRLADEQRNVSFFAYGVGRGVDRPELLHIIGGPPTCHTGPTPSSAAAAANGHSEGTSRGAAAGAAAGSGGCAGSPLSACGEDAADRYLDLCVRDESPW